jgi:hypothetical protein
MPMFSAYRGSANPNGFASASILLAAALILAAFPRFRRKAVIAGFFSLSLGLLGLRLWDLVELDQRPISFGAYTSLWALLVLVFLLSLYICLLALGRAGYGHALGSVSQAVVRPRTNEALKRIRGAFSAPLVAMVMPLGVGFTVWFLRNAMGPHSRFGFDAASAAACGLFLPLGILLHITYRFKPVVRNGEAIAFALSPAARNEQLWLWGFGLGVYVCGLVAESLGRKQYVMWTTCFLVFWLVVLSFSRFAAIASALSGVESDGELLCPDDDKRRVLLFVLSWIAFAYIYFELLSFIFVW